MQAEGNDTQLARVLHHAQRVDLPVLIGMLQKARALRPRGVTLSELLLAEGVVEAVDLARGEQAVREQQERFWKACQEQQLLRRSTNASSVDNSLLLDDQQRAGLLRGKLGPGARLGDYVLRERLDAGAMGQVFRAEHAQTGARVAIKTLGPSADEEDAERLRREGAAQAAVPPHPNVVRIYEVGESPATPYLVMELAVGGNLRGRLREGTPPLRETLEVAAGVARALAHMHAHGVLHRDLKPDNVVFTESGIPKLVDFGLARAEGMSRITRSGAMLGTPAYMSPEQALGVRDEVGPKADVYGLGAVLYELLTGRAPFVGASAIQVFTAVIQQAPQPPSRHAPGIPPALDQLCLSLLHKDPQARPSAQEAVELLSAQLQAPAGLASSRSQLVTWLSVVVAVLCLVMSGLVFRAIHARLAGKQQAASLPTPPATSASESASPTPSPAASQLPESSWGLRVGDPVRWTVASLTSQSNGYRGYDIGLVLRLELAGEVAAVGSDLALELKLERLAYTYRVSARSTPREGAPQIPPMDYDSAASSGESPLAGALGGVLRLRIDPARGTLVACEGADELQERVFAACPADLGPRRLLYRVPAFNEAGMRALLESVLHLQPPQPGQTRWTRPVPWPAAPQQQRPVGGLSLPSHPPAAPAQWRLEQTGQLAQLRWSARHQEQGAESPYRYQGRAFEVAPLHRRQVSGEAQLEQGRPVTVRCSDSWRCQLRFRQADTGREQLDRRLLETETTTQFDWSSWGAVPPRPPSLG
ncbi:MAG TPA: hypothetical protein DEA08_26450, partial [Planctomycetes bacterium]|nr:hypothetical protein [Planctomycetota bacterium]